MAPGADALAALNPMMNDPQAMQGLNPLAGAGPIQPQAMGQPQQPTQPGSQQDPLQAQLMQASQLGQQAFGEQLQRQRALADTINQLQQQQAQMPIPKMGYQPHFNPIHGQGALHDIGNLLGNIGKGALLGLGSTGVGQSVQGAIYGPGIREYGAKSGVLSERIKELQEQQKIEEEPLGAAASLQYRPFQASASVTRANAAQENATTNAKRQSMQETQGLQRLQQGWDRLSLGERQQKAREWFDKATINVAQARVDAGQDENSARIQAQEDIKSAAAQDQWATQHSFLDLLGIRPDIQAPAAAAPTKSATKGKGAIKPSGSATHIWTPQGLQPATGK